MILTNKQEQGLRTAVQRFNSGERYTCISGFAGSGKAQPVSTIIPTPSGDKRLGDIKPGDYVYDRFGKPTKVLEVFPQGLRDNYKVTFEDGRATFCNDEHLWGYYTSKGYLATKTLKEMLQMGLRYDRGKGGYRFKIPVSKAIEYEKRDFEIDPYVIGVFLGDGCCLEKQLTLSSENDEIPQMIAELIGSSGIKRNSELNYNWHFKLSNQEEPVEKKTSKKYIQTREFFKNYLPEICVYSAEKKIPVEYMYGSIEQRISLLQGLLDTDGSIASNDGKRFNIRFTSVSLDLIRGVQKIFLSLGYKLPTMSIDKRTNKYTTGVCYNLQINIPNKDKYKFFRLKRKKEIAEKAKVFIKRKNYERMAIIGVEKMEQQEKMVCLYVDNHEHLYLTNDYIVTHNTTLVRAIIEALDIPKEEVCFSTFTGKAAQVLQKMGNKNVMTLHKLLFDSKPLPNGRFVHIPKPIIDYNLVVVDEVSMAPRSLMNLLFSHEEAHVICLGDPF